MSQIAINRKIKEVELVAQKMKDSQSIIVAEYRGLTVKEITDLRHELRAENIEMKILKNNISKRAAEINGFTELKATLVGPNAVAFSYDDATAAARIIANFSKKHPSLVIKGGTIEGQVQPIETIQEIASLPSREGLYSMLLSVMQAPIRNMALGLKAVAEAKPAEEKLKAEETSDAEIEKEITVSENETEKIADDQEESANSEESTNEENNKEEK